MLKIVNTQPTVPATDVSIHMFTTQVVDGMIKQEQTPQVVLKLTSTYFAIKCFQVRRYDCPTQGAFRWMSSDTGMNFDLGWSTQPTKDGQCCFSSSFLSSNDRSIGFVAVPGAMVRAWDKGGLYCLRLGTFPDTWLVEDCPHPKSVANILPNNTSCAQVLEQNNSSQLQNGHWDRLNADIQCFCALTSQWGK